MKYIEFDEGIKWHIPAYLHATVKKGGSNTFSTDPWIVRSVPVFLKENIPTELYLYFEKRYNYRFEIARYDNGFIFDAISNDKAQCFKDDDISIIPLILVSKSGEMSKTGDYFFWAFTGGKRLVNLQKSDVCIGRNQFTGLPKRDFAYNPTSKDLRIVAHKKVTLLDIPEHWHFVRSGQFSHQEYLGSEKFEKFINNYSTNFIFVDLNKKYDFRNRNLTLNWEWQFQQATEIDKEFGEWNWQE